MLLDALKDFNWLNEPENVRFNEKGMVIDVKSGTDFWQNSARRVHKDNGHFFYSSSAGDFDLTVKWNTLSPTAYSQSGLMLRQDNLNWAKISVLSQSMVHPQIGTVVTNSGYSDWSVAPLPLYQENIWYKAVRRKGDIIFFYSLDGKNFEQIRLFRFIDNPLIIKVGVYAASPARSDFSCTLESIELKNL